MVGICAEDHPLADKDVWEAEDFIDETLITYPVPDEMLDLPKKVLLPKGINPPRRHSELTIAIIQLVASKRGIAALPYWTVMPYLEKVRRPPQNHFRRPAKQTLCSHSYGRCQQRLSGQLLPNHTMTAVLPTCRV